MDRILAEAEWVFSEPARQRGPRSQGVVMHDLLAAVQYGDRTLEVRLKVREAQNGKFFCDFFNESAIREKVAPSDTRISSAHESAKDGGDSRVAHGERDAAHGERPTVRIDDGNLSESVTAHADNVNLDVRTVNSTLS
jgi:hypothetical protein